MAKEKKSEEPREPFSANLRTSIVDRFNIEQARRKIRLKQDAIEEAIETWIEAGSGVITPPKSGVMEPEGTTSNGHSVSIPESGKHQGPWDTAYAKLKEIQDSGDEDTKLAILSNLLLFSRSLKREPGKGSPVPAEDAADILTSLPGIVGRANAAMRKKTRAAKLPEGSERRPPEDKQGNG